MLCCKDIDMLVHCGYNYYYTLHMQKEPDNIDKPFLFLAEQFYQIYSDKVDAKS